MQAPGRVVIANLPTTHTHQSLSDYASTVLRTTELNQTDGKCNTQLRDVHTWRGGGRIWPVGVKKKHAHYKLLESRDTSVGIALGYGRDDRGSSVRFPAGAGNFSFHHRVQNGSGAHPASYPRCTRGSFPGGKAAGT
jgi:hypothetical protein